MKTLTPFGVSDYLPETAKKYDQCRKTISTCFKSFGFDYIRTPTLEYIDSLKPGLGPHLEASAIKFFDSTNQLLCLRPDHTTPIARIVSSQMKSAKLPLKLFYQGPIFRRSSSAQKDMEIFQSGLEIIGEDSAKHDADVIDVCIKTLQALGYKDIGIDVGHADTLANSSSEDKDSLLNKDYVAYGRIPKRGNSDLFKNTERIQSLDKELDSLNIKNMVTYNAGLVRDLSYYTGLVFECYVEGFSEPVASGGRYDTLLKNFGVDAPAVGFAINVSLLMDCPSFLEKLNV
ncbi:hypothetical protein HOH45_04945 [bacterium]|jgi:ATP phosphoribosyltransferase regulatory subunit|nr:hypothetical protein [bacterium]